MDITKSSTPIAAMLCAHFLSILGSAIAAIAIPWLLLESNIGPERMSFVFAVQSGAAILAAMLGTPFLDRLEKRKTMIGCDLFLAMQSCALIALALSHWLNPIVIAAILASSAIASALSSAAGSAIIPQLLSKDDVSNHRVNGLIGAFHNFGDLDGPAIAGLVIAMVGSIGALAMDGVSFLMSALLLWAFIPKSSVRQVAQVQPGTGGRTDYLAGVKEIVKSPVLRLVTFVSAIINMVVTPLLVMLIPVMVRESGGNALGVGTMISCFGVGTFVASLLFVLKKANVPPLEGLLGSTMLALLALLLIPLSETYGISLLLFIIGSSVGYLGPLEQTLMQNGSPPEQIGRIMLAYAAFRTALVPVGYVIVGQMLIVFSVTAAFWSLSALLAVAAAGLIYSFLRAPHHWSAKTEG